MWADGTLDHTTAVVWTKLLTIPLEKKTPKGGRPEASSFVFQEALVQIVEGTISAKTPRSPQACPRTQAVRCWTRTSTWQRNSSEPPWRHPTTISTSASTLQILWIHRAPRHTSLQQKGPRRYSRTSCAHCRPQVSGAGSKETQGRISRLSPCPVGILLPLPLPLPPSPHAGVFTQAAGRVQALRPTSQRVHRSMAASPVSPVRE